MKGDFSRQTFLPEKHYSGVLLQQGRVQTDADWNEQQAIHCHRIETETRDVIGPCGAPDEDPGFAIAPSDSSLSIGKGHFYVDGILCENESDTKYEDQPDLFGLSGAAAELKKASGKAGLVYLDVWRRHITALEDSYIREKALGGPDTATRAKTVWQVRIAPVSLNLTGTASLTLTTALTSREKILADLKNAAAADTISDLLDELSKINQQIEELLGGVNCGSTFAEWDSLTAASTGKLNARVQPTVESTEPCVLPADAGYRRLENQLYRVEIHGTAELKSSAKTSSAVFKWSRDNGSTVSSWSGQSGASDEYLTVEDPGKDSVLGFAADQWVELTDDKHELDGEPGTLVRLVKVEGKTLTIDPTVVYPSGGSVKLSDFSNGPKIRRWDGQAKVEIPSTNSGWCPLESGVEIKFSYGTYAPGDYWLIPARTDGEDIEWPPFKNPNTNPIPQPPAGIRHHYCRLALVYLGEDQKLHILQDCRDAFPALTNTIRFSFVGGDGQEAMPDPTHLDVPIALAEPLQVGVSDWRMPLAGARVLFRIKKGNGQLQNAAAPILAQTGTDGIASCAWKLDARTADQQAEAVLLGAGNQPIQTPVRFHANLSTAARTSYAPGQCSYLNGVKTVQDAIDKLCQREGGGEGCCTTVGPGGQYETLDAAVKDLITKGQLDLCLCLLPGDHQLGKFTVDGGEQAVRIKITGCGAGTRIQCRDAWNIKRLSSFLLRDVWIRSEKVDRLMTFSQCAEVILDSCCVQQTEVKAGGYLCTLGGADHVLLANNTLGSYLSTDKLTPGKVLKGVDPRIDALYKIQDPEVFRAQAAKTAVELAGLSKTARAAVVDGVNKGLKNRTIGLLENETYRTLNNILSAEAVDVKVLTVVLTNIRAAADVAAGPTALALEDNPSDVLLSNNRIRGMVSLYGLPEDTSLAGVDLQQIFVVKKYNYLHMKKPGGIIRLTENRLSRVVVGKAMTAAIKHLLSEPDEGTLSDLFHSCFFSDNLVEGTENFLVAQNVTMASNGLPPMEAGQLPEAPPTQTADMLVAADAATYTGNYGGGILYDMTLEGKSREAGNLMEIRS